MPCLSELSKNIRSFRRNLGMTQRDLAERLYVSTQAISSWEQGTSYPDLENLCLLSDVLAVSIDRLLARSDERSEVYMIGVDGGGTKTEFALFSSSGSIKSTFRLPGTNASVKGFAEALSILRRGIDLCLGICPSVAHLFIGNAGSFLAELRQELLRFYPGIGIHITSDAVNALMCDDQADAAMILGTGSILLRPEGDGFRTLGGWGFRLGDPGSAYNFGREACRIARACEDGLEDQPMIYSMVTQRLGCESIAHNQHITTEKVAALAPVIFEADRQGIEAAGQIIEEEMRALARMVNAICPDGGKIVVVGGVAQHYADRLLPVLGRLINPGIHFILPSLPPVYGACRACLKHFQVIPEEGFAERFRTEYLQATANII